MSDPLPPTIAGRYRPLRLLGKGGMGAVYLVEHAHTGQHLALKLLTRQPGASVERFKREARAASRIQSDHIVRVTDADVAPELDDAPFLVMELLDGEDLEHATGDRPAPPADVVEWMRQVARGLSKAHDAGIVHRDLKPENLFLTRRDDGAPLVKILDFGIAKSIHEATALTGSDAFLGTPGYMAPEQTDSSGPPVTLRADLYSLGLVTFKLLTGRMYWKTGSLAQLLAQILAEPMPPASERGSRLGPAFDDWFRRACDRNPAGRFASAREQIDALSVVLGVSADTTWRPSDGGIAPKGAGSHPVSTLASEGSGSASLNGSITDLTTARRRNARLFGSGAAIAAVVAIGLLVEVGRRAAPPSPAPSAVGAQSVRAQPVLPEPTALAAPPAPPKEVVAPITDIAASDAGSTRNTVPEKKKPAPAGAAPGRATVSADAGARRDPLEGPW